MANESVTRLVADVVTGKLDVREAAAKLSDEPDESEPIEEVDDMDDTEEIEIQELEE
jgi:type I restriction enzyme S subunit